ncbi:hypothetical protein FKM82_008130 [Ascaphus truei]
MDSVNFKNMLLWSPPAARGGNGTYTYTAQYKLNTKRLPYNDMCNNTVLTHCDFSIEGNYGLLLRVRAQLHSGESDWVEIPFDPYVQTIIGPPEVKVTSRAGILDISFSGPIKESDNTPLNQIYGGGRYRVLYWKESTPSAVKTVDSLQNTEILTNLEEWTMYCTQVQLFIPDYNKSGQLSQVICERTTDDGKTLPWVIAVTFMLSMFVVFGIAIGIFYLALTIYKTTRYIFFPAYSLPQHLKEYLNKPFFSTPHFPTQSKEEEGEPCEPLTFVSEEKEDTGVRV